MITEPKDHEGQVSSSHHPEKSLIGILMLETTFPRIPGDIGNPDTFSFPVIHKVVPGATPERVVIDADASLVDDFIDAGKSLTARGIKAITTSCGFLALFHQQLVEALPVPVYTSSLLQVHLACRVIRRNQKVGIITARKQSLTAAHLAGVGIEGKSIVVAGMEAAEEFSAVFINGKQTLNEEKCRYEMRLAASKLVSRHPDVGAIVLECTNMPPYADTIRQITGLPVFDAVTLVNHAFETVAGGSRWKKTTSHILNQ